jgi:hypothetical protein
MLYDGQAKRHPGDHEPPMNLRFSLITLFAATTYFAVCCAVFIYTSLWWGTLVIGATILMFIASTIRAVTTRHAFWLGFSLIGWAWLTLLLGFYADDVDGDSVWSDAANGIFWAYAGLRRPLAEDQIGMSFVRSLHHPGESFYHNAVPVYFNLNRLLACASALLVGLLGGYTFHVIQRVRSRPHQNANSAAASKPG